MQKEENLGDKLHENIVTSKWRVGLTIAVAVVFLLSIATDIATIALMCKLHG